MTSNIQFNIWAGVLIIGIFQGFFIIPFLFRKKTRPGKWLSLLVLVVTLNLCDYLSIELNLYHIWPHFLYTTHPFMFLIGPCYFFYIKSLLDKNSLLNYRNYFHFIPFILAIFYHLRFYVLSGEDKIKSLDWYKSEPIEIESYNFIIYVGLNLIQILCYLILSYNLLKGVNMKASNLNRQLMIWLRRFCIGFSSYWIILFCWILYLTFADSFFYEVDMIVMLLNAILINILAYSVLYHDAKFSKFLLGNYGEKYKRSSLSSEHSKVLLKKLINLMQNEKPYLDPNLKLSHLAEKLSLSTNILSQVINQELNKNFFEFINEYRIGEAIRRLSDPKFSNVTIVGIARDSGFGNKNTFNRLFIRQTGLTPTQFIRKQ